MNDIEEYKNLKNRAMAILSLIDNQPLRMNVIYYAARGKLKEIAHNMILASLLGEKVILKKFLNEFMPSSFNRKDSYNYEIKREFNHIDVSLEDESNFIIIENKVNDAVERPHQIFHYVERAKKTQKEVFVIYLNSVTRNYPTENSLNSDDEKCVFDLIRKDHFIVLSYMYDILPWLDDLEKDYNETDYRYIETSLFQYIDYLKMKFNINDDLFKEMKEKIDDLLNVNSNCCDVDRLSIYENELSLLKTYSDNINKVKIEMVKKLSEGWKDKLKEYWGESINLEANKDDDKTGFVLSNGKIEIVFTSTEYRPWWGVRIEEEDLRNTIKQELDKRYCNIKTSSSWNMWHYTTFSEIMSEAKYIHDVIENQVQQNPSTIK